MEKLQKGLDTKGEEGVKKARRKKDKSREGPHPAHQRHREKKPGNRLGKGKLSKPGFEAADGGAHPPDGVGETGRIANQKIH